MGNFIQYPVIDSAIASAEGYGIPKAIPTLTNNPGDLENGDIGYGMMGNGITNYPSIEAGMRALDAQISAIANGTSKNYSPNESINSIGQKYAGQGTQGSNWANNVANALGISPNSSLFSNMLGISTGFNPDTFNAGRIAAFLIGIVTIGAGLLMFKSTQTVIATGGKVAKKAVEVAAA